MENSSLLYEGKMKQIIATENPERVIVRYTDCASAFNNVKQAVIVDKGKATNAISALIYRYLESKGIKTHFVELLNERDQLCRKVQVIPLEFITRNVIAGSIATRLGLEEGTTAPNVIYDLSLKNDVLDDPFINDHHAVALGIVSYDELKQIYSTSERINQILVELFERAGIRLVDFKIEFGRLADGEVVLADEISPDTCRLWDIASGERLDRDRFRYDMGRVRESYEEVLTRLQKVL
ncbi:MAG: phosphoribosylaminoimidazolesuccinocarboxamide synthase [Alistipes sp.]|nr:phosphoribosylaminoimidazolesuccinocarboxamide synthase [Alistipes sp.]